MEEPPVKPNEKQGRDKENMDSAAYGICICIWLTSALMLCLPLFARILQIWNTVNR